MCHVSPVTCHVSPVKCHLLRLTCHMSPVTSHLSRFTCHVSPVTCHLSRVTCHMSYVFCFFLQIRSVKGPLSKRPTYYSPVKVEIYTVKYLNKYVISGVISEHKIYIGAISHTSSFGGWTDLPKVYDHKPSDPPLLWFDRGERFNVFLWLLFYNSELTVQLHKYLSTVYQPKNIICFTRSLVSIRIWSKT